MRRRQSTHVVECYFVHVPVLGCERRTVFAKTSVSLGITVATWLFTQMSLVARLFGVTRGWRMRYSTVQPSCVKGVMLLAK